MSAGNDTYGSPGSTLDISSNGNVWALDHGATSFGSAVLRAYDASDVTPELDDCTQAGNRDTTGGAVKFTVPAVARGRVDVAGDGARSVYWAAQWSVRSKRAAVVRFRLGRGKPVTTPRARAAATSPPGCLLCRRS